MRVTLTFLRVHLANVSCLELLLGQLRLFLHPLLVSLSQGNQSLHPLCIMLPFFPKVIHFQCLRPHVLVEVHQHVLLQPSLAVVDGDAVVVAVKAVDKGLYGRFVKMTKIGCGLARLLSHDDGLRGDQSESIDHNFTLDGLNGIDNDGDSARCELFERLLCVDIHRGQPASETWVRMVPSYDGLRPMKSTVLV